MKLQRFVELGDSKDVRTFERRLVKFAHDLEFDIVAAALVLEQPGKEAAFLAVGNVPEEYAQIFSDPDKCRRDPVLRDMKRRSVPFIYDQQYYVRAGAGDLWEEQAVYGYKNGIAVALHLPDNKHFLVGLDRHQALPNNDEHQTQMLAELQLMAVYAQSAALRLMTKNVDDVAAPHLTPREREILLWTMDGKSAWAVGELLGVSEHTVNFHMRNIFAKLNSSSKHQAVIKALSLGLI